MGMCEDHWGRLRDKIKDAGLDHLIANDGELAAQQFADRLKRGLSGEEETTATNFDPLMSAYLAIQNNAAATLSDAGINPLYILVDNVPDAPCEMPGAEPGQMWPHCSLCYLGLAHELSCKETRCSLPKNDGYAFYLDRAVEDQVERATELGLIEVGKEGAPE